MAQKQQLPKIHLACGSSDIDTNKNLVKVKNNIASATNGTILVKIDLVENYSDVCTPEVLKIINGKFIHKEVWKEIHHCDLVQFTEEDIYCHKDGIKKTFEYSEPNGTIWDEDSVILDIIKAGEEKKRIVCYNHALISLIGKIFDTDKLNFSFTKGNRGSLVFPYHGSGRFAVLMPIETAENRYYFT